MTATAAVRVVAETASAQQSLRQVGTAAQSSAATVTRSAAGASTAMRGQAAAASEVATNTRLSSGAMVAFAGAAGTVLGSLAALGLQQFGTQVLGLSDQMVGLIGAIAPLAGEALVSSGALTVLKTAFLATAAGARIAAIGTYLMSGALAVLTSPIFLVIVAVLAIIAVLYLLYTRVAFVRAAVQVAFAAIAAYVRFYIAIVTGIVNALIFLFRNVPGWIRAALSSVGSIIASPFQAGLAFVRSAAGQIGGFFGGVAGAVGSALSGVFDAIISPFERAFGWVQSNVLGPLRGAWNGIAGTLNGFSFSVTVPKWVPGIGGRGWDFSLPNIPFLASGAVVSRATLAMIGEGPGREIVAPEALLRSIVAGAPAAPLTVRLEVTVNVPPTANPAEVGRQTTQALAAYVRANGSGSLGRALGLVTAS